MDYAPHGSRECPPDHFFDFITFTCMPCESVCEDVYGTESECQRLCPEYFSRIVLKVTTTTPGQLPTSDVSGSVTNNPWTVTVTAMITVILSLVLFTCVVIAFYCIFVRPKNFVGKDVEQGCANKDIQIHVLCSKLMSKTFCGLCLSEPPNTTTSLQKLADTTNCPRQPLMAPDNYLSDRVKHIPSSPNSGKTKPPQPKLSMKTEEKSSSRQIMQKEIRDNENNRVSSTKKAHDSSGIRPPSPGGGAVIAPTLNHTRPPWSKPQMDLSLSHHSPGRSWMPLNYNNNANDIGSFGTMWLSLRSADSAQGVGVGGGGPSISLETTPSNHADSVLSLYRHVEAKKDRFPWLVGCMISSDHLEVVLNLAQAGCDIDTAYDRLCADLPRNKEQYLVISEDA